MIAVSKLYLYFSKCGLLSWQDNCTVWTRVSAKVTSQLSTAKENVLSGSPGNLLRVVKGFFVIRERPFLFPVNCEMANFFLVKRHLVTEP